MNTLTQPVNPVDGIGNRQLKRSNNDSTEKSDWSESIPRSQIDRDDSWPQDPGSRTRVNFCHFLKNFKPGDDSGTQDPRFRILFLRSWDKLQN